VHAITAPLIKWAVSRKDVKLFTPRDDARRAGIVAFATPQVEADSRRLREAGIVSAVREGAIRIAAHFHNNKEDIARVIEVLEG
jgi:cysteine desulfurase/selenocysteine lyase